jgi:hypothetical protein
MFDVLSMREFVLEGQTPGPLASLAGGTLAIRVHRAHCGGVKGDWVEIVIDAGTGSPVYEVSATRAGRRVEVAIRRGVVEVSEVTRSGVPVRTARFMSSRVIALVEHPASRPPTTDERRGPVRPAKPA